MEEIMTVSAKLENEAREMSCLRSRIKEYLIDFDACYDKFTITDNDTFLGYVSEEAITGYLTGHYGGRLEIRKWADRFDLERVKRAVDGKNGNVSEVLYVKDYFYDKYDLEIIDRRTGKSLYVDVKTAETWKYPRNTWNFLYPVVQNQRSGKDCVILCYYYKTGQEKKIILVGYISEENIARKPILKAGTRTRFGTVNQIDNYETKVTDYRSLSGMIGAYF